MHMQSSLIGKVEKANRYAQETDRIMFNELAVNFRGDNDNYNTGYKDGQWHCSCHFFSTWGLCSHTMALQKILSTMLSVEAQTPHHEIAR